MKLSLDIRTSLSQTLTPQQIQYLKLLQLPMLQLEQHVTQEIEQNPMLEENFEGTLYDEDAPPDDYATDHIISGDDKDYDTAKDYDSDNYYDDYEVTPRELIDDAAEPFEFYKMIAQDDNEYPTKNKNAHNEEDDGDSFQIKDEFTFYEELLQQLRLLPLTDEEFLLGEQIIGNVDGDGYLRRDLYEIVEETNLFIAELNLDVKLKEDILAREGKNAPDYNPARQFAVSPEVQELIDNRRRKKDSNSDSDNDDAEENLLLSEVNLEQAERVLKLIRHLDPPGIASRTVQECLIAQCKALTHKNAAQKLALEILENAYEPFTMKHFHIIKKQLEVTDEYLKEALEVIRRLNPKPGGGDNTGGTQTVIPDFLIEREEDTGELLITVNDSRLPVLRLSDAYEKIRKEARYKMFNKETREWIRNKYEDAKFLMQAIKQRKNTMLKVMTSIAGLQRDFFDIGSAGLKPLIYKNVAEQTGLDISTVCRIVNGKYVQTEFGTTELKYFFSESLPSDEGEEIATTVIKQVLKDIIDQEPKDKPYSDDKIAAELKKQGYNVARRTVAKYREQLRIPVARLRRELL